MIEKIKRILLSTPAGVSKNNTNNFHESHVYYWNQLLAIIGNYCLSQPQQEAQEQNPRTGRPSNCLVH